MITNISKTPYVLPEVSIVYILRCLKPNLSLAPKNLYAIPCISSCKTIVTTKKEKIKNKKLIFKIQFEKFKSFIIKKAVTAKIKTNKDIKFIIREFVLFNLNSPILVNPAPRFINN
jgi:hypothetical protein